MGEVEKKGDNKKEDNKKLILLSGVALVCILLSIFLKPEEKISTAEIPEEKNEVSNEIAQDDLESKLKNILSQINGAGDVDVMITLETSEEIQPAYNINSTNEQTSEKDQNGGERTVSTTSENKTMVTSNSNLPIVVTTKPLTANLSHHLLSRNLERCLRRQVKHTQTLIHSLVCV